MLQVLMGTRIPFMKYRKIAYALSALLIVAGAVSVAVKGGFRLGVDFAGGIIVEYRFDRPLEVDRLRAAVEKAGYPDAEIQASEGGETFLFRIAKSEDREAGEASPSRKILEAVQREFPGLNGELLQEEVVGPRVGKELKSRAFLAVVIAMGAILIFVTIRYTFKFALGGIIALAHDILVVLAFLSFLDKEITVTVIAALLTIGGYSINDKIVVFDRVRERKKGTGRDADEAMMDLSLNQTLSRTIITGLCVIFTLEALLFMGGPVIHDFAFAMLLGTLFGTYSSIWIAAGLTLDLIVRAERRKMETEEARARIKS
jgi:preprotein translocase subunit SecF